MNEKNKWQNNYLIIVPFLILLKAKLINIFANSVYLIIVLLPSVPYLPQLITTIPLF